jgi:hypothetical protein
LAWWNQAAAAVVGGVAAFVGNAVDNLHSNNPGLVALGVAESLVIAAPVAAMITIALPEEAAAGVGTIGGVSAGVSQIRMMGALAAAGIVIGGATQTTSATELNRRLLNRIPMARLWCQQRLALPRAPVRH